MTRVACLISGGGSNMVALVQAMQAKGFAEPAVVISNVEGAGGLRKAVELGVPQDAVPHKGKARDDFETELQRTLDRYEPDLICLAGFMRVLTPAFVARWQGRMLNIHPSLLPKYPGLNTHARAIDAGDAHHGCSVHEVIADLDAGPILGQARVTIDEDDTAESLAAKVLTWEHKLYPLVLECFLLGDRGPVLLNNAQIEA